MARSKYIYIVFDALDQEVVGVFTVKHEMVSWAKKHLEHGKEPNIRNWIWCRAQDGQWQVPYGLRAQYNPGLWELVENE